MTDGIKDPPDDDGEPKSKPHRKPPAEFQFQPGVSGNPGGRPKGAKGVKTILRKELFETVEINVNGKKKKVSKLELLIKTLVNLAIGGKNLKAIEKLITMAVQLLEPDDEPVKARTLTSSDLLVLQALLGDDDTDDEDGTTEEKGGGDDGNA